MDYRKNFFYKILYERYYFGTNPVVLYNAAKNNKYLLQRFRCLHSLNAHAGCVNTISWNSTGRYILSGSDDLHLSISDAFSGELKTKIRTGHTTNIFSAKYLPNTSDMKVVSCSGDGCIIYTDLNRPETSFQNIFDCQEESVYDIVTVPNDPNTFLTCSYDHTVRWYDLRVKQSCQNHPVRIRQYRTKCNDDVLINCDYPVTAIAVNQLLPWQLAIGCSDSIIRIYDRRMLSTKSLGSNLSVSEQNASIVAKFTYDGLKDSNRITSLAYSRNCQQILASYSNDNLYLFNLHEVRDTISNGKDADVISEKPRRTQPPYKRFRLRGDWSDTGPISAFNTDDLIHPNNTNNNSNNSNNLSSSSNSSVSSGPLNSTTTSSNSSLGQSSSSTRSGERLRQLNTILNILFRTTFLGSNETLNESINSTNEDNNSSTSVQINSSSINTNNSPTETIRERSNNNNQLTHGDSSNNNISVDNSESSSDNSLGLFIQIFDEDSNHQYYSSRDNDDDDDNNENGTAIGGDDDEPMEDDGDFDSDTTNDSVFNHDSASIMATSHNSSGRQRSRSSSSTESRQTRRKARNIRNQHRQNKTSTNLDNINKQDGIKEKRLKTYKIKNFKKFAGHRNSRTVIKEATFWGDDFIISGSDCGHIFFWDIETGEVVMILEGDQHVVNCLQPHPTDPILASSGIDYDVKIWGPDAQENLFDPEKAKKLMSRNKHLLEESRDTVTVPARVVLSLFSSMQQRQQYLEQQANEQSSTNDNSGWRTSLRGDWITRTNDNEPDHDHDMDESF